MEIWYSSCPHTNKYFAVPFQVPERTFLYLATITQHCSSGIFRFFHLKRAHFIPAVCKVFVAKVISQPSYRVYFCKPTNLKPRIGYYTKFYNSLELLLKSQDT